MIYGHSSFLWFWLRLSSENQMVLNYRAHQVPKLVKLRVDNSWKLVYTNIYATQSQIKREEHL